MTNPCLDCKNKDKDKNNPECKECGLRVQYVNSIMHMTGLPEPGTGEHKICPYKKTGDKKLENIKEKTCRQCGNQYPGTTEFFHANKNNRDGLQIYCKTCRARWAKDKRKVQTMHASSVRKPVSTTKQTGLKPISTKKQAENILSISFDDYPEILEKIKKTAKEEFRQPEMQILFWINKNISL